MSNQLFDFIYTLWMLGIGFILGIIVRGLFELEKKRMTIIDELEEESNRSYPNNGYKDRSNRNSR